MVWNIELAQLMEDLIGDLVAVPQPIEVKLYGDNPAQMDAAAKKVAAQIGKINGVVGVRDGINPAGDALEVQVDPVKAALAGVDPQSVADQVPWGWPARSRRNCRRVRRWWVCASGYRLRHVRKLNRSPRCRSVIPVVMSSRCRGLRPCVSSTDNHRSPAKT